MAGPAVHGRHGGEYADHAERVMSARPALVDVIRAVRSGRWPTVIELCILMRENGRDPHEVHASLLAYQRDLAAIAAGEQHSHEEKLLAQLRALSVGSEE